MDSCKPMKTPISPATSLGPDPSGNKVEETLYRVDRKSTSGMAQFLGPCLVSWGSKKQNSVALSTAESEYIAAAACCSQLLWIRNQLKDFGIIYENIPILRDNTRAINISKNPV